MKQHNRAYSKKIEDFSANSLYERACVRIPMHDIVITRSSGNEICRIIHSCNRTFVSVLEEHTETIYNYLTTNSISEKLCSPLFYREVLDLLGFDHHEFLLEPREEFWQDIKYNCTHTLDFVCANEVFIPQNTDKIETIHRGDNRFILENDFDSTMYCISESGRIISCSYYKPNRGEFENTCSMQVFTRPEYRGKGFGKLTASAATNAIVNDNKLALWVSQVENIASRRIAASLGYALLGGELRIVK